MPHVLGLDLSTQSLSSVLLDLEEGTVIDTTTVNFGQDLPHYDSPQGFLRETDDHQVHSDPRMWLEAVDLLFDRLRGKGVDLSQVTALSGAGQQHGSVYLREGWEDVLRGLDPGEALAGQLAGIFSRGTSPIWMDASTGPECAEIAAAAGGPEAVCEKSGSVAIERFTGPQIRAFFKRDPEGYAATARIHLFSSFLACLVTGADAPIDHGDGAGMNLANLRDWRWDPVLLAATAPDLAAKLPVLRPSATVIGEVSGYFQKRHGLPAGCRVVAFTGDNPSSLSGMGAEAPGRFVISLGTSDTLFAAMEDCRTDPRGFGHVFGNPAGGYMSLLCFRNGSLAREKIRDQLGLSWEDFGLEGLRATPLGNNGNLMIPFFGAEITPRVHLDKPALFGSDGFTSGQDKPALVRACLEGQFLNMWVHTRWLSEDARSISLTGGASQNDGIAQIVADVFGAEVNRLEVPGSVALGGALRAAADGLGRERAELADRFCRPDPRFRRTPDPAAHAVYRKLADAFTAKLGGLAGAV